MPPGHAFNHSRVRWGIGEREATGKSPDMEIRQHNPTQHRVGIETAGEALGHCELNENSKFVDCGAGMGVGTQSVRSTGERVSPRAQQAPPQEGPRSRASPTTRQERRH